MGKHEAAGSGGSDVSFLKTAQEATQRGISPHFVESFQGNFPPLELRPVTGKRLTVISTGDCALLEVPS